MADIVESNEGMKKKMKSQEEKMKIKAGETKQKAAETKEEIKEKGSEVKEEAVKQKEKLEEGFEGRNPAEKFLSDMINNFRQRTGEINDVYYSAAETTEKPLIDILETNENIIVIADISGVDKDDIDIGVSKNNVTITTNFKDEIPIEGAEFIKKERNYGETTRSIDLPASIKSKDVKANFKACTLTITLPKIEKDIVTKIKVEE